MAFCILCDKNIKQRAYHAKIELDGIWVINTKICCQCYAKIIRLNEERDE